MPATKAQATLADVPRGGGLYVNEAAPVAAAAADLMRIRTAHGAAQEAVDKARQLWMGEQGARTTRIARASALLANAAPPTIVAAPDLTELREQVEVAKLAEAEAEKILAEARERASRAALAAVAPAYGDWLRRQHAAAAALADLLDEEAAFVADLAANGTTIIEHARLPVEHVPLLRARMADVAVKARARFGVTL